jgi:TolB-like protein
MHAPSQLAYLQDGVRDMLTSRLAWQGKVQVIDRTLTSQALQGFKADITLEEALRAGRTLKADYVLFGSITALGQAISIDAKMAPVAGKSDVVPLYAQTKSLDEVIPRINQFAQEINQKVFARPSEQAQASSNVDSELLSTRNPELLVPDTMMGSNDRISYLNPNFVEVTSDASLRQPGLWRSQTFQGGIVGMDAGDLDGDGRTELVTITSNRVGVYRREHQGLRTVGTFEGNKTDRYLWVSVVDTNRDGNAEIFVTNLRKRNLSRPGTSNSVLGDSGYVEDLGSFGLAFTNGKLQVTCENIPYFLNGIEFPKRGKILIGQQKAARTEGAFKPGMHEMQLVGGSLNPTNAVNVPDRCNVFNFALGDINNDRSDEVLLIDYLSRLVILNPVGDQIWKSDKMFAATTNMFEARLTDRRYNDVDYFSIPSPILVADLNKDGIAEIVVNRSLDNVGKFMPNAIKFFDKSEVLSLSWDQLGLVENWKTREISGMVTSIRIADLNNDGTPELVVSLVMAKDFLKLWESKSTIFSYDLNVSAAKAAAKTD